MSFSTHLPPEFLHSVREQTSLIHIIGQHVRLVKKGSLYVGLCPFHHEKSPSFTVYENKQYFCCFGCGEKGDVISFIRKMRHFSFMEAVEYLAHSAGMSMPRGTQDNHNHYYMLMEEVCKIFQRAMPESARQYLLSRGITREEIDIFRLGWASGSDILSLAQSPSSIEDYLTLGLLVKNNEKYAPVERFRQRIMFPIMGSGKKIVGFGGRTVGDAVPKYMNSPQTVLFTKGHHLYSHYKTQCDKVIIVEGYMDVIAVGRSYNAVAPMGTAITDTQLKTIFQRFKDVVVCFDGDEAGCKAARLLTYRALPLITTKNNLLIASMPQGMDPHGMITQHGMNAFDVAIQQADLLSEFLWNRIFTHSVHAEDKARAHAVWRDCINRMTDPDMKQAFHTFFYEKKQIKSDTKKSGVPFMHLKMFHERMLWGMVIHHPPLLERVHEELASLSVEQNSVWLPLREYLLTWDGSTPLHTYLTDCMGNTWKTYTEAIARHLPPHETLYYDYWIEIFNAYQQSTFHQDEIRSLASHLFQAPESWEKLKNLTQL